jgi:hypothetical protein
MREGRRVADPMLGTAARGPSLGFMRNRFPQKQTWCAYENSGWTVCAD